MGLRWMSTWQKIVFGDCRDMHEIRSESVQLMVTSPPYYNAPFDYPGLFKDYDQFLELIETFSRELYRVLAPGRVAAYVTDDMLVKGEKYPVVADVTRIMIEKGFRYRDKIVWVKPKGYTRISRRSGVILQNPYPMYFYPDNIQESIIIFQKGKFDYGYARKLNHKVREVSKIDTHEYNEDEWYLTVWNITNVLPLRGRLEEGVAAFPQEIPRRLIRLFTYAGETVLDPFLGSGTTMKVAKEQHRNCWGYEIDLELKPIIFQKINLRQTRLEGENRAVEVIERSDAKRLRALLQRKVRRQTSVVRKARPRRC